MQLSSPTSAATFNDDEQWGPRVEEGFLDLTLHNVDYRQLTGASEGADDACLRTCFVSHPSAWRYCTDVIDCVVPFRSNVSPARLPLMPS